MNLTAPVSSPSKLKNVTGKVSDNLTLTHLEYPSWSPDGKKLVFQAVRKNSAGYFKARIYRINLDGTGLKQLAIFSGFWDGYDTRPDWGPTGLIAFNVGDDLWTMKPDGTGKKNLTDCNTAEDDWACGFTDPSWSPDGTKIAVDLAVEGYMFPDTQPGIAAIDAATGEVLMSVSGNEKSEEKYDAPTWSPDGTQIAFFGFIEGEYDKPYDILTAPVEADAPITNIGVSDDLSGPDATYPAWAASEAAAG